MLLFLSTKTKTNGHHHRQVAMFDRCIMYPDPSFRTYPGHCTASGPEPRDRRQLPGRAGACGPVAASTAAATGLGREAVALPLGRGGGGGVFLCILLGWLFGAILTMAREHLVLPNPAPFLENEGTFCNHGNHPLPTPLQIDAVTLSWVPCQS